MAPPTAVRYDPYVSRNWLSTRTRPGYIGGHLGGLKTEPGRVSSALAPAPRLGRALTSTLSLPDLTNTGIIHLERTSVVLPPLRVPYHPPDHLTALKAHLQVRSTQRRRRRMETREISLASSEHTVRLTARIYRI
jgi:hypothetical protein